VLPEYSIEWLPARRQQSGGGR